MTEQEIRDNAPDGSQYYSLKYGYLRTSYGNWFKWNGREFIQIYVPISDFCRIF